MTLSSELPTGSVDSGFPTMLVAAGLAVAFVLAAMVAFVARRRRTRSSEQAWAQDAGLSRGRMAQSSDATHTQADWWGATGEDETAPGGGTWLQAALRNESEI